MAVVGRSRNRLDQALALLGDSARGEQVDASDRDAADALFGRMGHLHHLVAAASSGIGAGPLAALARDDLARGFDGKFWVQWQCAQAALPYLSPEGSITFVTAISARVGRPGTSGLAAINDALGAMVLLLAHELGKGYAIEDSRYGKLEDECGVAHSKGSEIAGLKQTY